MRLFKKMFLKISVYHLTFGKELDENPKTDLLWPYIGSRHHQLFIVFPSVQSNEQ